MHGQARLNLYFGIVAAIALVVLLIFVVRASSVPDQQQENEFAEYQNIAQEKSAITTKNNLEFVQIAIQLNDPSYCELIQDSEQLRKDCLANLYGEDNIPEAPKAPTLQEEVNIQKEAEKEYLEIAEYLEDPYYCTLIQDASTRSECDSLFE